MSEKTLRQICNEAVCESHRIYFSSHDKGCEAVASHAITQHDKEARELLEMLLKTAREGMLIDKWLKRRIEAFLSKQTTLGHRIEGEGDHVAWLRFRKHSDNGASYLQICDSDSDGAFKVYRKPIVTEHFESSGKTLSSECLGLLQDIEALPASESATKLSITCSELHRAIKLGAIARGKWTPEERKLLNLGTSPDKTSQQCDVSSGVEGHAQQSAVENVDNPRRPEKERHHAEGLPMTQCTTSEVMAQQDENDRLGRLSLSLSSTLPSRNQDRPAHEDLGSRTQGATAADNSQRDEQEAQSALAPIQKAGSNPAESTISEGEVMPDAPGPLPTGSNPSPQFNPTGKASQ